jgi:hypothetical protein
MQEAGTSVVIVVRCIAATRAAGTVYEQINQSINQSNIPRTNIPRKADDELPPPRGARWELSEKQFGCL